MALVDLPALPLLPRPELVEFSEPTSVRAADVATGNAWEGLEQRAVFPKPGSSGGTRSLRIVKAMIKPEETQKLLLAAETADLREECPGSRVASCILMRLGQYECESLTSTLQPIVDSRLLPYVRARLCCPEAVASDIRFERHSAVEGIVTPVICSVDRSAYCTAVVNLNPEDFEGGLFVQPAADLKSLGFLFVDSGDVLLHQYDLPLGTRVCGGEKYSLVVRFKDSILACLTDEVPWYKPLAESGDADAQANLAMHIEEARGTESAGVDGTAAVTWYTLAAEQGHDAAQNRLGSIHSNGALGMRRHPVEAVSWWHKAALQGHRVAQRNLAEMLLRGQGTAQNEAEALKWLRCSAEQGDLESMHLLAVALARGCGMSAPDDRGSLAWTRRAAELGHGASQHHLGVHLAVGCGTQRDAALAAKWLEEAAQNGHTAACCNLGALLAEGSPDLPCDLDRAMHLFERAVSAGDVKAERNISLLHRMAGKADAPCLRTASANGSDNALDTKPPAQVPLRPSLHLEASQRCRLDGLRAELHRGPRGAGTDELLAVLEAVSEAASRGEPARASWPAATSVTPLDFVEID